jgi:hypothetical protein
MPRQMQEPHMKSMAIKNLGTKDFILIVQGLVILGLIIYIIGYRSNTSEAPTANSTFDSEAKVDTTINSYAKCVESNSYVLSENGVKCTTEDGLTFIQVAGIGRRSGDTAQSRVPVEPAQVEQAAENTNSDEGSMYACMDDVPLYTADSTERENTTAYWSYYIGGSHYKEDIAGHTIALDLLFLQNAESLGLCNYSDPNSGIADADGTELLVASIEVINNTGSTFDYDLSQFALKMPDDTTLQPLPIIGRERSESIPNGVVTYFEMAFAYTESSGSSPSLIFTPTTPDDKGLELLLPEVSSLDGYKDGQSEYVLYQQSL